MLKKVLVICLIGVLSACDKKQVDTPKQVEITLQVSLQKKKQREMAIPRFFGLMLLNVVILKRWDQ